MTAASWDTVTSGDQRKSVHNDKMPPKWSSVRVHLKVQRTLTLFPKALLHHNITQDLALLMRITQEEL